MCKNFNVSASVKVDCGFFAVGVRSLFLQLRLDSKRQLFYRDEVLYEQILARRRYFWHEGEILPLFPRLFLEDLEVYKYNFQCGGCAFLDSSKILEI